MTRHKDADVAHGRFVLERESKECGKLGRIVLVDLDQRERQSLDDLLRCRSGDENRHKCDVFRPPKFNAALGHIEDHSKVRLGFPADADERLVALDDNPIHKPASQRLLNAP